MRIVAVLASVGALGSLPACLNPLTTAVSAPTSTCPSGTAEILVGDGFLQRVCGCTETSGTSVGSNTSLGCTVTSGTRVYFHFVGTTLLHQIVTSGTPSFASSAVYDPKPDNASDGAHVHVVRLTTSGTYSYRDLYNPGLRGTVTVP